MAAQQQVDGHAPLTSSPSPNPSLHPHPHPSPSTLTPSRKTGKQLSPASARIKATKILKQQGKGHLQLMRPKHKVTLRAAHPHPHTRTPAHPCSHPHAPFYLHPHTRTCAHAVASALALALAL